MGRMKALARIWTLIWQFSVGWIISLISMGLGLLWSILDIIVQLLFGGDGLTWTDFASAITASLTWHTSQMLFAFTGGGSGQWNPLPDL